MLALWEVKWCGNIGGIIEIEADTAQQAHDIVSSSTTDEAFDDSWHVDSDNYADVFEVNLVEED